MTLREIQLRLEILLAKLPEKKAEQVLEFAEALQAEEMGDDAWTRALVEAESYWFSLPLTAREQFTGKVVALKANKILDTDASLTALQQRVRAQFPNQPVLYLDANAQPEPTLVMRSPRLN